MRALAILALGVMLAGCQTNTLVASDPPPMPANVRARCDPMPASPPRGSNMGTLYTFSGAMVSLYVECATRDGAKADWIESQKAKPAR